jgi:hypothetical protein
MCCNLVAEYACVDVAAGKLPRFGNEDCRDVSNYRLTTNSERTGGGGGGGELIK